MGAHDLSKTQAAWRMRPPLCPLHAAYTRPLRLKVTSAISATWGF